MTQAMFLTAAAVVALILIRLLRSGQLREKYSALWIFIGTAVIVLAAWPDLLGWLAAAVGVLVPSNLLFFLAVLLLLGVTLHLSLEASHLEDETRILAEEVAMLRLKVDRIRQPGTDVSEGTSGDPQ